MAIKLLIVEDDANKRDHLHQLMSDRFPAIFVEDAGSLIGGIGKLRHWKPDIVLLDMTLPNYDLEGDGVSSGGMEAFGGEEFLRQAKRFRLTPVVIVVTQFETFQEMGEEKDREELNIHLEKSFPSTYRGMVYYHASIESWSDDLEGKIRSAIKGML